MGKRRWPDAAAMRPRRPEKGRAPSRITRLGTIRRDQTRFAAVPQPSTCVSHRASVRACFPISILPCRRRRFMGSPDLQNRMHFEAMNLPAAGFATTLFAPSRRAATIPSPGGEGQGEGGLPSLQFVPALCCHRFMGRAGCPLSNMSRPLVAAGSSGASCSKRNCPRALNQVRVADAARRCLFPDASSRAPLLGGVRGWVRAHHTGSSHRVGSTQNPGSWKGVDSRFTFPSQPET